MTHQERIDRFLAAMNRLSRIVVSLESFTGDTSLNKIELTTLLCVFREEVLSMSKLANCLGIGTSTATGIIDRLVEKKMINRERNTGDRRIVKIKLTEKGQKTVLTSQTERKELIRRLMSAISPKEQEDFTSILEKIAKSLGEENQ